MTLVARPPAGVGVRDAAPRIERGEALVLDVREREEWEEWEAGRIPQAIHIPLHEIGARLAELPR